MQMRPALVGLIKQRNGNHERQCSGPRRGQAWPAALLRPENKAGARLPAPPVEGSPPLAPGKSPRYTNLIRYRQHTKA